MFKPTLLIRADASLQIGFGHVLRGLSLAQAWQDAGGAAVFACAALPAILAAQLEGENCRVELLQTSVGSAEDAQQTQNLAQKMKCDWVICDGYHFDGAYLRALKSDEFSLLAVDDFSDFDLSAADAILNPNAGATAEFYARFVPNSKILAGSDFALLRREFRLQTRIEKVIAPKIERVLIAMGGADVKDLVPRALSWLQSQNFRGEVVVLSGARTFDLPDFGFDLKVVSTKNEVPGWMKWCDIALAAAGSTTWELACCGTPAILTAVAPNQRALAIWCRENGVALDCGEADESWENRLSGAWHTLDNPGARRAMSARASHFIDGQGAARAVQHLWPDALVLRRVTLADAEILWQWRNDAQTRAMSLQSDFISWETHWLWFKTQLANSDSAIWMARKSGEAVGSVRFAREREEATISIVIAPDWRGRGIGSALAERACRALFAVWNVTKIWAKVKVENAASRRAFEKAGFRCQTQESNMPNLNFILERGQ